jgi:hypothetical protein
VSILALCPSRGRPQAARETLASFLASVEDPASRIVFVVDRDDPTLRDYPKEFVHVVPPTGCMGDALRRATVPDVLKDATSVGMIGDDNRFATLGWDVTFDTHLTERVGVCYGDDGFQHERLPTAWWVSRPLVDAFGIAPKGLRHLYMDNWWKSLAEGAGCLRYFGAVSIPHLHPHVTEGADWINTAKADATYKRGNSRDNARLDRNAFEQWIRRARRDDVRKARVVIGHQGKRRVLADWHHPALWESLSILFEDRFGWELYAMGGEDWTKHGWTLASPPPIGWSAADYLSMKGAKPVGDHWERKEREYPRPRKMVTPDQAFGMSWDFVLGSVPDHQRTFAALAGRLGARFVHQVGNAKHPIDQSLQQIVLASSVVRLRRTPHVVYHQEFDRTLFAPSPIATRHDRVRVASLMLRLDWTSCEYRWLSEAPGIEWDAPGGKDPNASTYLAPMTKVAQTIRNAGWVWMDKRIGDGYGHTIHNAAAMGRPLIGHASHYKGMLAEPFWRDLETCVDLDRHDPKEALRLIWAISNDPGWHAEMGANIQATFDDLVDFDAEADRIRSVLI